MKKVSFMTLLLTVLFQLIFAHSFANPKPLPGLLKVVPFTNSFTVNELIDYTVMISVPCAGDIIQFEGQIHVTNHVTMNKDRVTVKFLHNRQGLSGTGLISGDKYQATGVTQYTQTGPLVNGQYSLTYPTTFNVVGQGTGNNLMFHTTFHFTVNTDGTVITEVKEISFECK